MSSGVLLVPGGPYRSTFLPRQPRTFRGLAIVGCVLVSAQAVVLGVSMAALPLDGALAIDAALMVIGSIRARMAWTGHVGFGRLSAVSVASDVVLALLACLYAWIVGIPFLARSVGSSLLLVAMLDALLGLAMLAAWTRSERDPRAYGRGASAGAR